MNPKDEAGPLWLLLKSSLESLPVKPKWILLAVLAAALLAFVVALYKRQKRSPISAFVGLSVLSTLTRSE
jgi:hypothetical protein